MSTLSGFGEAPPPPAPTHLIEEVLGRYGWKLLAEPVPVPDSVINANFRVETSDGPRFVKLYRPNRTRARIERDRQVAQWAAERGLPALCPLADERGRFVHAIGGRLLTVFPWVDGYTLPRHHIDEAGAAALGEMHGRLHATLAAYPVRGLPADAAGSSWDTEASVLLLTRVDDLIRYYASPGEHRLRIQEGLRVQLELLEFGHARPVSDFAALRRQPCHGDYHDRNVLFRAGEVLAVVDWEQACLLPPAYEVLRAITFAGLLEEPLLRAYLEAYRRHHALTASKCELAVEMWWQSRIHETWTYRTSFIEGDSRVDGFFAETAEHIRQLADPGFRSWLAECLRRWGCPA